jgi:hypothetical protein
MSKYITRTAYFLELAQRDPNIKHGVNETKEGETYPRKSFIQVATDQDSLSAEMINGLHVPFIVQKGFSGSLTDTNGDLRNQYQNTLQFLTKVITTDQVPTKEQAIKNAKEQMLIILKMWLNKFYADVDQGCTGDFRKIDFASVRFFDVGPISDDFFGWELSFSDDEPAHDVIDTVENYFV